MANQRLLTIVVPRILASVTHEALHVDIIFFFILLPRNSHCLFHRSPHLYISLGALSK